MIETKTKHKARRGRIFPEIQWSDEKKAAWKANQEALYKQCRAIFERVQPELIKTHYNWFMAIEPNSEDYFLHHNEEIATKMFRQKYPNAIPMLFKINETGICGTL